MRLATQIFKPTRTLEVAQDILLVHGMGSASTSWRVILPRLRENFRVITIDLPGHGQSEFDEKLPMDPISLAHMVHDEVSEVSSSYHLVGNSLGGWIALEMAARFSQPVRSLTALAPAGLWINPFQRRYPATALLRIFAKATKPLTPIFLHFEWARALGFATVSPRWRNFSYQLCIDAVRAMSESTGYYPAFDGMLMKRFDGEISQAIPTTIIFGDSDNTLPEKTCQERSLAPAHARWVILPETGHAPMWDSVDEVVAEILITAEKNEVAR
jgi:pimeloyl-ACP methyl ester carboxylesterase